jgi:hypothetical protein
MAIKIALLFLLLNSNSKAAENCPDLSGSYACEDDGERTKVVIDSNLTANPARYDFVDGGIGYTLLTDDIEHSMPDSEHVKNAKYKAKCEAGNLVTTNLGELYDGDHDLGMIAYGNRFHKTEDGNLLVSSKFLDSNDETLLLCKKITLLQKQQ